MAERKTSSRLRYQLTNIFSFTLYRKSTQRLVGLTEPPLPLFWFVHCFEIKRTLFLLHCWHRIGKLQMAMLCRRYLFLFVIERFILWIGNNWEPMESYPYSDIEALRWWRVENSVLVWMLRGHCDICAIQCREEHTAALSLGRPSQQQQTSSSDTIRQYGCVALESCVYGSVHDSSFLTCPRDTQYEYEDITHPHICRRLLFLCLSGRIWCILVLARGICETETGDIIIFY